MFKNVFTLRDSIHGDINFGRVYPVWSRFVLPGDVWKISSGLLIRYQPLRTPPLTQSDVRVRFAYVPLRLVEENTELIITGSKNGKYDPNRSIPTFESVYDAFRRIVPSSSVSFNRGSLADWVYGLPSGSFSISDSNNASAPAAYWLKAFSRFLFDYYRDENFSEFEDFEDFVNRDFQVIDESDLGVRSGQNITGSNFFVNLRKDGYITSALPWQLKGVAPTIATGDFRPQFSLRNPVTWMVKDDGSNDGSALTSNKSVVSSNAPFVVPSNASNLTVTAFNTLMNNDLLNFVNGNSDNVNLGGGFNMAQFREMAAMTRIFERLARTGSRYTEYLQANFGTAPSDGTLQRAQYLGGYKIPIVTTEVLQTSEGDNPVGTMRGHGITNGGDRISTFHAREFGIILACLDVRPKLEWTQGVDREKTYKARWDFYNPSLANLSEQQVRNGEVYYANDGLNDDTFGFVPYAQELRTSRTRMAGEMRGNLADWNQAVTFGARPSLNQAFLNAVNYTSSWTRPFVVQSGENPMILDFSVKAKVFRPLVRNAIPGLVDHH